MAGHVSHRSVEITDDVIANLTVALSTGHLKSGRPCRGERVAKYNRLTDIEGELKTSHVPHVYAGRTETVVVHGDLYPSTIRSVYNRAE